MAPILHWLVFHANSDLSCIMPLLIGANLLAHKAFSIRYFIKRIAICKIAKLFELQLSSMCYMVQISNNLTSCTWPTRPLILGLVLIYWPTRPLTYVLMKIHSYLFGLDIGIIFHIIAYFQNH